MDFLDELQQRVLLGDGAMGTELLAADIPAGQCLEDLCISRPELVQAVHQQYIAAGARVIETNSLGANAVRLAPHGLAGRVNELNWTAAQLAKEVAKGTGVYVAGSVGPLGITAEQAAAQGIDRHGVFLEQIGALLDGGCNLIFLETFLDLDELLIALNAKHTLHHCPVVTLLAADAPARFSAIVNRLVDAGADVIGVNCVDGGATQAIVAGLTASNLQTPLATFPSAGLPQNLEGRLVYTTTPEAFAATGQALIAAGVRLVGGCCGIGPAHIAALAKALKAPSGSH